jgi:protein gp37
MAGKTGIAWTQKTCSPWHGCAHKQDDGTQHPACDFCYAAAFAPRNPGVLGVWGPNGTRVRSKSFLDNLRRWNRTAAKAGAMTTVFPSICDPFEAWDGPIHDHEGSRIAYNDEGRMQGFGESEEDSYGSAKYANQREWVTMQDLRAEMFRTLDACPNVLLLALTKRPENVLAMWLMVYGSDGLTAKRLESHRKNVAVGVSISDQRTADIYLPRLLALRDLTPYLFVSVEPLLGPIDLLSGYLAFIEGPPVVVKGKGGIWHPGITPDGDMSEDLDDAIYEPNQDYLERGEPIVGIDGIIIGCESRGKRVGRTFDGYWDAVRSLNEQCRAAGVAVFNKQHPIDGLVSHDPAEWPEWARSQELPWRKAVAV